MWNGAHGKGSSDVAWLVMSCVWALARLGDNSYPIQTHSVLHLCSWKATTEQILCPELVPLTMCCLRNCSFQKKKQGKEETGKAGKRLGTSALGQLSVRTSLQGMGWPYWRAGIQMHVTPLVSSLEALLCSRPLPGLCREFRGGPDSHPPVFT